VPDSCARNAVDARVVRVTPSVLLIMMRMPTVPASSSVGDDVATLDRPD